MIIQEFKGEIEGVQINKEFAYWSTDWFIEMVDAFIGDYCVEPSKIKYDKKELVEKYHAELIHLYFSIERFCLSDIENDFARDIENIFNREDCPGSDYEEDFKETLKIIKKISDQVEIVGRKK